LMGEDRRTPAPIRARRSMPAPLLVTLALQAATFERPWWRLVERYPFTAVSGTMLP
jgi:hypothetical protein